MNKQQLASKIWESANRMRSKIEANEYKDYILGFMFYKFLSDKEVKFLKENDFSEEDIRDLVEEEYDGVTLKFEDTNQGFCQRNIGYFIEYKNLFSTWIDMGREFDVSNVTDALSAFNRLISPTHKRVFENIFQTLETGLSKLGDTSGARTKAISGLLQLIKDIPMDGKQDYDVLGYIYEYLLSQFASNAGKKAGEFYTPHEVSLLMSEIVADHLSNREEIKIYDPTSGSGSLLINIGNSVKKYIHNENNIKYYAQELKENTYNLTRMNLVMRGIKPDNIVTRNADTLEDDWPYFDESDPTNTYSPLYVDAVVSNPPYSQAWEPTNKEHDPRYAEFGLAPKSKADYAFLLHDLFHVKTDGIMTIVLPHGVLFRGGEEGNIRRNLLEKNHIDAIIGLPANIFYGTGIPTIIMVLKQNRKERDVLIVEASKGFIKEGKNNKLRASDIKRIVDVVSKRKNVEKYARCVSIEEIRENDYNLNIPRYVDSSEPTQSWDLYASMFGGIPKKEIDKLHAYWSAFPNLRRDIFSEINDSYSRLNIHDIKKEIHSHKDILSFHDIFAGAFNNFAEFLRKELLEQINDVVISKEEQIISEYIFHQLENIELVDKYEAYQLLHDQWEEISADLEMIQTEGFHSAKKVDPKLVLKKKAGKEEEVQDGWIGHIIPFELVQDVMLQEESEAIREKENRLEQIPSEFEEIIEEMSEEEKNTSVLNDNNDSFVMKEIPKKIKELMLDDDSEETRSFIEKLKRVQDLNTEQKELKAQVKRETAQLITKTKDLIENLSDEEVYNLLEKKWIDQLIDNLKNLPVNIVDSLVSKVKGLSQKYETTYFELGKEIQDTERSLAEMIDQLEGDEFDMKGLREFKSLLLGGKDV